MAIFHGKTICAKITGLGSNACVENECCLQGEFCIKAIYPKQSYRNNLI